MAISELRAYALPEPHDIPQNRVDWAFEPQRAALLVHDMQDYFVSFWDGSYPMVEQVITNIAALRDYYKQHNIPVYYTARLKGQSDEDRALLNDIWGPGLTHSLEQQKVVGRLTPNADDAMLVKWRYNALYRSPLKQMLKESGRNQPIITGVYAHIGCMTTATNAFIRDIKPSMAADTLADFSRDEYLMSLKYVAGWSGRVVTTGELLPAPVLANKATLRKVILPLLDESDKPFDGDSLIGYGLDSVRMMTLVARQREVHGSINFVMLTRNPTIDAWWKLLSHGVK